MTKNISVSTGFDVKDLGVIEQVVFGVAPYTNKKGETTIDATIGRIDEKDGVKKVVSEIFFHQNLLFKKIKKNGKQIFLLEEVFAELIKQIKDIAPYAERLMKQAAKRKADEAKEKEVALAKKAEEDKKRTVRNIAKLQFLLNLYKTETPTKADARQIEYLRKQIKANDPKSYAKLFGEN